MEEVTLHLNDKGHGAFYIVDGAEQMGEMVISVSGGNLTVYHTEVSAKVQGRGLAKKLLDAMVGYARGHGLKVITLCPYVHAQFSRHPEEYADVWNRSQEMKSS